MRVRAGLLSLSVMVPGLLVSALLWLMALVVLPSALAVLVLFVGGTALVLLSAGGLEPHAVRLLTGSRSATAAEDAVLTPVLSEHDSREPLRSRIYVRRTPGARTPPALGVGHSSLVVTPWLVHATCRGWLSPREARAIVVHADARHRAGEPHLEVAVLAFTTPWRAITAVSSRLGQRSGSIPFLRLAWSIRGVVGLVAVIQSVMEGRVAAGILAGGLTALTYLVPAASRARERGLEVEADRELIVGGLGQVFAAFLRRSEAPVSIERLRRLERPVASWAPVPQMTTFSWN